ncbi:UL27 virion membrane glycoprotein B [Meleagrid alphaherpesvirus 1]|uniref:UL27 virion membrane glycoprotein B n=2 Tax=Meleagrid herpesvirus 1 TaxID=37108 RepID=Q9DPQ9_MEHV1|nr:envelope glycoprotein B [Meleagrid alphaherpesvirus 1]AKQ48589.1 envelope glycoprotein B [iBAC vector pMeHV1-C7]AKQ48661.1 envelope glycoprotein B [iBAC vector pMeHV1-C9]AKQ48733.1 envelope glycoprotein B [iBAC vector pMeHV1-C10]AKQ48805.1 envelope glycoprotein B [iBAC vector pMeHV1-C17]AKQ48877.1 envelope glycoprotein B [iBAC vector pMeHV1-C18]
MLMTPTMKYFNRSLFIFLTPILSIATSEIKLPNVTAREIVSGIQLSEDETTFYVCPPPVGSTIVRLEPPRKCPEPLKSTEWGEGIAILFKENISPYKFKVTLYYKNVIQTTTWTGTTYRQITNRYTDRTPVSIDEITDLIDGKGKCSSKARYLRNNVYVDAYDRDENEKQVLLRPSKFSTAESRAWHTTNETYTVWGSPWVYRTGTSVNCIVEEMDARSAFPYTYFAMANGDIANMSPFYGTTPTDAAAEPMSYPQDRFRQFDSYFPMDLDTRRKLVTPVKRNFLVTQHFTVGWTWAPKISRVCSMAKWKEVTEMLRARVGKKFRFMARELSATFISNTTEFNPDRIILGQCVKRDAEAEIDKIFKRKYNDTHVKMGHVQYFLTLGGFVVAYQPILSKSLAHMYLRELLRDNRTDEMLDLVNNKHAIISNNATSVSRLRRDLHRASSGKAILNDSVIIRSTASVQFAMLQFLYDHIQAHINEMFSRIATAWCELQNKELVLWREAIKINPSATASATLGKRVGAKMLGDVAAVSSCIEIDSDSVTLQNSMRVVTSTNTCYSRPLVLFSYGDRQDKIQGQLGENNELIPTLEAIEPCSANHRRYFLFGDGYAFYENYNFVKMVDAADIQLASTFVELNLTLLEDREILPLSVYTKEELRDVGVLDYAEVARRNQLHELKFYDINRVIEVDTNYAFMNGLAELFNGMGQVGQAIGKVVVGAAGAIVSTVSGISAFMSNPFGALAIGLIVIAGIIAAFLAYRYVNKLKSNPMKALYPMTTEELKDQATRKPRTDGSDSELMSIDERKLEAAREMIKYMALVSAEERHQKKLRKKKRGTTAILSDHLSNMRLMNGHRKYDKLNDTDSETDDEIV